MPRNKDVEAALVCTLLLQESNVALGPCGWKDQFHQAQATSQAQERGLLNKVGLASTPYLCRQGGLLSI